MSTASDILKDIDAFIGQFHVIPEQRSYWLIRTQGGLYYDSFRDHRFVAIEHDRIGLSDIRSAEKKYGNDTKGLSAHLKSLATKRYPEEPRPGLVANQIYRFVVELKKGDIVIIPSENSEVVSIGEVTSSVIPELSKADLNRTGCPYAKRKAVKWLRHLDRGRLDLFLYRMLQAHQAINDITHYSDIIERSIGNFFITKTDASLVLEVQTEEHVNARHLFSLGHYLLDYSEDFFKHYNLPFNVDDIEVKINVNSQGKIQLKGKNYRVVWMVALLAVAINGGGLKINTGELSVDLSTDGVIQKIIDYQNQQHDRNMVDQLSQSMDTLHVKAPDDAVKVFKQFSTNKDLPK